ncbi:translocator protein [Trichogramma pretiosum]|uniref:translocator protein n=1 Tax=Trichogramma pretiosum TaxID=7493 RepID=UPI0006C9BAD3|nr:translocator protein [Trichogramma pretiosum]
MTGSVTWPVIAATVHPNIGGWLGNFLITRRNLKPWYQSLKKPSWTPPNWAFGPAWTTVYCSMGYASHLVLRDSGSWENAALPLSVYGANLALNWAWTPIFFGAHKIKWALYEIIALWGTTAAMGVLFYRVNTTAGLLILPYLAWNTLAVALNYAVWRDNEKDNSVPAVEDKKQ